MSADPLKIIGEILGEPAATMRNPVNAGYMCPYINSMCVKRSHRNDSPYPVCSIWHRRKSPQMIAMCPKRFFEADLQADVIKHCWQGEAPGNPFIAHEIKMDKFGMVDFVIADVDPRTDVVRNFLSVELQAMDCTGSVEPAYQAVMDSVHVMAKGPGYGINWANVRKRYVNQLVMKGFYHHQWGSKIVSVIQTPLFERLHQYINFDQLDPKSPNANVVFLTYDFKLAPAKGDGAYELAVDKVVGTSHSSLMMAALYHKQPSKEEFLQKVMSRLKEF